MKADKSTKADKVKTLALEVTKQMSAGKYGQASKVLKELLALDPTDLKFKRLSATLNLKLGNRMTAKSLFESLVQEALDSQDRRLAESLLREYLDAGPRYVPFRELLGRVCEENGNNRAASVEYGRALEILIEDQETEDPNRLSELYNKIKRLSPGNPLIAKFKPVFNAPLSSAAPQPKVSRSEGHGQPEIELEADAPSEPMTLKSSGPETTPPSKPAAEPKAGPGEQAGTRTAPAEKSIVSSVMSFFKSVPTEAEPQKPPAKPETAPPEQSTRQTLDVTPTGLDSTATPQEPSASEPAWSQATPPESASVQAEQPGTGSPLEAVEAPQETVGSAVTGLSDLDPTEEKPAERASEPDAVSEDKGPNPSMGLRLQDGASQPPVSPPEPAPVEPEPSPSTFQFKFQSGQAEPETKVDRSADVKQPQSEAVTPASSLRWADAATESRAGAPLPDDDKEAMLTAGPVESTSPPGADDVAIDQLEAAIQKDSGLDATSPTDTMQEWVSGVEGLVPTGETPASAFTPMETVAQEGAVSTQDQEQQPRDFDGSIEQPLAAPSYDAIPITEVEQAVEELAPHLQQEPAPSDEPLTPFSAFGTESDTGFQPPSEEPAFSGSSSAPSAETSFPGLGDLEEIQHQEQVSQDFSEDSKPLTLQSGMATGFGTSPSTESPDVSAPPWYQPEPEPYERPRRRAARSHTDQSAVRGHGRTAAHGGLAQSGKRLLGKLKRMVRVVVTIAVATTLLPLGVAALVWIGLNEQPNSAFQNLSRPPSRTIGDPQKNGYFILFGLGAGSGLNAATVGYAQWDATKDMDQPRCFEGESTSTLPLRFGPDVYPVAGWMRSNDPIGKFRAMAQSIQGWSRRHAVLLSRYRQWLRMPFEDWGYGHRASPNCPEILHAHRLYVAQGFARGLSDGAIRLATDLRKWRGLLSQARTLSLKRMASIAFNEDLLVLSSLLTRTDVNSRTTKPLLRFTKSLKPAELSWRWAIQSELAVEAERAKSNRTLHIASEPSSIVRVLERMPLPRQRLMNDYADYYHALLKVAENPTAERPKLYEFTRAPAKGLFDYILNPIDNFMSRPPKVNWDRRVIEIIETEARVRLITLQAKLRGTAPSTYAGRIAKTGRQYYDPFTGFSMVYNPSKSRLYSVGSDIKDDDGDPDLDVTVRLVPYGR